MLLVLSAGFHVKLGMTEKAVMTEGSGNFVGGRRLVYPIYTQDGFPTTAFGNDKALLGGEFAGGIGCRYNPEAVVNQLGNFFIGFGQILQELPYFFLDFRI